jgi:magnesium-protoporphyrin IX monomethyl ester (oxidative) cyclase
MKFALIYPYQKLFDPPLGLAYIASYLREYGNFGNTIIIDKEDSIERIKKEKPDLVGISAMFLNFDKINVMANQIKKEFDIPLLLGGPHVSSMPQNFLNFDFDIGVIGEGEQTTLELVELFEKEGSFDTKKLKSIKGIVYRNERNALKMTEPRPLIEPLDKIPFPARDLLKMKEVYLVPRKGSFSELGVYSNILTSRGCPYNCVFCSPSLFWKKFRCFTPEYVVEEMKLLISTYKLDGIIIWDDLFVVGKHRLQKIVELVKDEKINEKVKFWVFARANIINRDIAKLLREMNVTAVGFGLESGSEKILNYLKTGTVTVEDNRRAIRLCRKQGIKTMGNFIIGSPDETEEDLQKTFDLFTDKNLDESYIHQLTPFPGTQIWDYAKQKGIVSDDINTLDFSQFILDGYKPDLVMSEKITKEKFKQWYDKFRNEELRKNYNVNIKKLNPRLIFNPNFLKKVISNTFETFRYIKKMFKH